MNDTSPAQRIAAFFFLSGATLPSTAVSVVRVVTKEVIGVSQMHVGRLWRQGLEMLREIIIAEKAK